MIATTGVTLHMALEAAELMAAKGARPSLLHFPVVKPLDLEVEAVVVVKANLFQKQCFQ